jgi:hypothetical protein
LQVEYRDLIYRRMPLIERSCTSKSMFTSRREANQRARHSRGTDGSLRPYHCDNCGGWHLGHRRHAFGRRHTIGVA